MKPFNTNLGGLQQYGHPLPLFLFATVIKKEHSELNTNIIFRNVNLREEIIDKYFKEKRESLIKLWNKTIYDTKHIYNKIERLENINQNELDTICNFYKNLRIPNQDRVEVIIKYIFSMLKNSKLSFSYPVQDFVLSYLPYFYNDNDVRNIRYVLCDNEKMKSPATSLRNSHLKM